MRVPSEQDRNQQPVARAVALPASQPNRWLLLLVTLALLLAVLTAFTATLAGAAPDVESAAPVEAQASANADAAQAEPQAWPDWIEIRGLSLIDVVGDVPDEILKDLMISWGDGIGTVVYESGRRDGDTLVINTTIYPRLWRPAWAANNKLTVFGCLGQRPFYDHIGTVVPPSVLRIYKTNGVDITDKIKFMHIFDTARREPLGGPYEYHRYPQIDYGPHLDHPLPMEQDGLHIPPNGGCRLEIVGEDIYPLKGVFTLKLPQHIEASVVGRETLDFHTYIGPGAVGIFTPFMSQMKSRFGNRAENFAIHPPDNAEFFIARIPPLPGDPYVDQLFGPPYVNAQRPTAATYRQAIDINTLGSDLVFSGIFPTSMAWRDADQSRGREYVADMSNPRRVNAPEYVLPPTLPYDNCYTQGNCSNSLLDKAYSASYPVEFVYLNIRRLDDVGTWVPVRLTGPTWEPSALNNAPPNDAPFMQTSGSIILNGGPYLEMTKETSPSGTVDYHSLLTFTIVVSNSGDATDVGVKVTDTLPNDTTFVDWVEQPSGAVFSSDVMTWTGDLNVSQRVTFTFIVSQTAGYGQTVQNGAQAEGSQNQPSAQASFTVRSSPTLTVSKSVLPEFNVGYHSPVTYTVVVRNEGPSDASGVVFTDTLPGDTQFADWIEQPTGAITVGNEVQWAGDITANDAVTFTFIVSQTGDFGQQIANVARYDHAVSQGSDTVTFTVEASPTLEITKEVTPDEDVAYLSPVTFTIVLRNSGRSDATAVVFTDTLPAKTQFAGWIEWPAGATHAGGEIQWAGDIAAYDAITFSFLVSQTADYDERITNIAQYWHASGQGQDEATFAIEPSPTLDIDKWVEPSQNVGYSQPVTYTIVASNKGITEAQAFLLTDTLHPDTQFSHWLEQPGDAVVSGDTITWTGTLTAQSAITLTFVASQTASYGQTVENTAEFSFTVFHGTATAEFTVAGPPELSIAKTVTPDHEIDYLSYVTFTIVVANAGGSDATGVAVSDTLPAETDFSHWLEKPTGAVASLSQITWIGTVTASDAVTLSFSIRQTAKPGSLITNTASYTHESGNDAAEASFTVSGRNKWSVYLPVIQTPYVKVVEPDPPPVQFCPCGWFDNYGRIMDFHPGEQ